MGLAPNIISCAQYQFFMETDLRDGKGITSQHPLLAYPRGEIPTFAVTSFGNDICDKYKNSPHKGLHITQLSPKYIQWNIWSAWLEKYQANKNKQACILQALSEPLNKLAYISNLQARCILYSIFQYFFPKGSPPPTLPFFFSKELILELVLHRSISTLSFINILCRISLAILQLRDSYKEFLRDGEHMFSFFIFAHKHLAQ